MESKDMTEQDRQSARSVAYSIKTFCEQADGAAIAITVQNGSDQPKTTTIDSSDGLQIDRGGVKARANFEDDRQADLAAELIRSGGSALSWGDQLFALHRPMSASVSTEGVLRIESGRSDPAEGTYVLTAKTAQ